MSGQRHEDGNLLFFLISFNAEATRALMRAGWLFVLIPA